jgi:predicted NBD/HSP70 family sugar kinase/mannose-6-phosphate isomerase class I
MYEHLNKLPEFFLGVDVGGSHISSALVSVEDGDVLEDSFCRNRVSSKSDTSQVIINQWVDVIKETMSKLNGGRLKGIGIAMPGPFDYKNGTCLIDGVDKYHALFGINIKSALRSQLDITDIPIVFENDASCFGIGEGLAEQAGSNKKIIAVTLGTGLGAAFIDNGQIVKDADGVPEGGVLYNIAFKDGLAEDYISTRGILKAYAEISGTTLTEVKEIADRATVGKEAAAREVFTSFANNIADCLSPWIKSFKADCLVIGGRIAKSSHLFLPQLIEVLHQKEGISINIKISNKMEMSAIAGAADLVKKVEKEIKQVEAKDLPWRKSSQNLLPSSINKGEEKAGEYNIYPFHSLDSGKIFSGYASMAEWMMLHKAVVIDGYIGNDWSVIRENLTKVFKEKKVNAVWYEASAFLKDEQEIEQIVSPFLGEPDSVWGSKTSLHLEDFYNVEKLENLQDHSDYDLVVLIGVGAALSKWDAPVIYIDLPKNEIQYRMRAGSISNLGTTKLEEPAEMYKRFYFVDWVVLNEHRTNIKKRISVVADGQWKDDINWSLHDSISARLELLCKEPIRVRPWFEAGAWGGQWLKQHIPSLNKDEINYAWSFELIVPENGLVFESDGKLLEVSFDWLMEQNAANVLGKDAERFGTEFPIRFDFLDTFDGGNLSIQCHPSLEYIQDNFGERITQDETYYILDCKENANVYLGFQDDINPAEFKGVLEQSFENNSAVDIEKYVQSYKAKKHDFFLIPNGTVHSAGTNNLVLEISATPYIFTFKMYDWVRPDLNGNPRPINIDHAFNNLKFQYKGERVKEELVSKPYTIEKNNAYELVHYPTHHDHFYDVHRIDFSDKAKFKTNNQCQVLMLVEGQSILVKTKNGKAYRFNYAETFVVPANAEEYEIINEGGNRAKVIKAFIK